MFLQCKLPSIYIPFNYLHFFSLFHVGNATSTKLDFCSLSTQETHEAGVQLRSTNIIVYLIELPTVLGFLSLKAVFKNV